MLTEFLHWKWKCERKLFQQQQRRGSAGSTSLCFENEKNIFCIVTSIPAM
jgi:hypothetical protein